MHTWYISWHTWFGGVLVRTWGYRRRHVCDQNLEFLNNDYTETTHDLLGNVLVTAKYEGESIVKNHPNTKTSDVCTALARSFADIGDIVRGRDMFKSNEDVEKGLKIVFQKIYDLKKKEINDYDGDPNYYKLREAWWTANRDQVWKAITCKAPTGAHYFLKSSPDFKLFSNDYCGHKQGNVPTNLDYVPQYLRWFEEWAEEFCRKKKDKLNKVKEACRGKTGGMYCSHNGCDCEKTIGKIRHFVWDDKCNKCSIECGRYENWMKDQKLEFEKQKEKYESEINRYNLSIKSNKNFNDKYYKEFYDKLKVEQYESVNKFLELLKKGNKCKNIGHDEKTYFNKSDDKVTFSRSKYCQVCPDCGVECTNGRCKKKAETDENCGKPPIYTIPTDVTPTDINVLYSGDGHVDIVKRLSEFCRDSKKENGQNNEIWQCYYMGDSRNQCKIEKSVSQKKHQTKIAPFDYFFDLWVTNLLRDNIDWKNELKNCINNTNKTNCNKTCNDNCKCFQSWLNKKEDEWNKITGLLKNKNGILQNYYNKLKSHFDNYFFLVINNVNKGEEKWKKLKEDLKKEIDFSKLKTNTGDSQDSIKLLLDHEKKNAGTCLQNNPIDSCPKVEPQKSDEKVQPQDTPPNPCVNGQNQKVGKIKSVRDVAEGMQKQASVRHDGDINKLKGNISLAKFNNGANPRELKTESDITNKHTNGSRHLRLRRRFLPLRIWRRRGDYNGPCEGKDNENKRFSIGENWKTGEKVSSKDHVFLPPRREHFCTSNLENLKMNSVTSSTNVNASFLVDVLLAANKQVEHTMNDYKPASDQEGICRAIRYSFADLGDIIKGTDLWVNDGGEIKTQGNLVKIFEKIKVQLKGKLNMKYDTDNEGNKYINLRKDWWEANRRDVWKAMKCKTTSSPYRGNPPCSDDKTTPYDDYIPQRLRWMTEWAEWYCKEQSRLYGELVEKCAGCKGKQKCTQGNGECAKCKTSCENYKKFINTWQPQWKQMEQKYSQLYEEAKKYSDSGKKDTKNKNDYVLKFLNELQKENGVVSSTPSTKSGNTATSDVYATAAGYVHQELPNMDCQKQTQFCKNKNGVKPPNGAEDVNYTFKDTPNGYDVACKCDENKQKPPETPKEDACKIVKELLKDKKATDDIDGCKQRDDRTNSYPQWKCGIESGLVMENGICMPPRRQKLCLHYLTILNDSAKEEDLRKAFIKCAAAETFLSWQYYKSKHGNGASKLDEELKKGKIPEEFLRSMFYTFGDYRDFLFGTDISKGHGKESALAKKIDSIFPPNVDGKTPNDKTREQWWNENGPKIWEAMLCALSYDTETKDMDKDVFNTLTDSNSKYQYKSVTFTSTSNTTLSTFAEIPQFLRWMTEWGEEFCKKRKEQVETLKGQCTNCEVSSDGKICEKNSEGCTKCREECTKYQTWLKDWKDNYNKQKDKFKIDKENDQDAKQSDHAYQYLGTILQKICKSDSTNGDCEYKCMEATSTQTKENKLPDGNTNNMPASLDDEPQEVQGKCNCTPPPDACTIVDGILGDKSSMGYHEGCREKYKKGVFTAWDCRPGIFKDGSDGACMPPRRKRLFLKKLHDLKGDETQVDLRQAVIECAAIETFFSWHEFKKEKEKEIKEKKERDGIYISSSNDDNGPQKELYGGKIPDEFKRQMFYTLGDYRDIFFGKDMSKDMGELNDKINKVFANGGKNPSVKRQQDFWNKYAQDIWKGMLCALSYDSTSKIMNTDVHTKLTSDPNNNYETVTFSGGFNSDKTSKTATITTKLVDFSRRPPYFRWLEEWAHEFCRKQTYKLAQIKVDCRGNEQKNEEKYCDGDGFDCKEIVPDKNRIFADFNCPSCAKSCRSYKKWINTKNTEFNKQTEKYKTEINKTQRNNDDNGFSTTLKEKYNTIAEYLLSLKGPCSKTNTEDTSINFKDTNETFKHATNCAPCPVFGVEYKNGNWINIAEKECHGKKITAENIRKNNESIKQVLMHVSDNGENGFSKELEKACQNSSIFEGIRKDEWICGNICKSNVCVLKNLKESTYDEKNILFRALFKRWLENFLEDYNKINAKISHCTNNSEGITCINGCEKKCNCVDIWIEKKSKEWENIRDRYLEPYEMNSSNKSYSVRTFLETLDPQNEVRKAIKPFTNLINFEDSNKCMDSITSKKKDCENNDVITILINKLKNEISDCQSKHKVIPGKECPQQSPSTTDTPQNDNENDTLLDTPSGFPPPFCNVPPNPCGDKDATNVVGVEVVAEILHQEAKDKMLERSGKKDEGKAKDSKVESVLKGNIKEARFKNGTSGTGLNSECDITDQHTNDSRRRRVHRDYKGPCTGKNQERFKIGTDWKDGDFVSTTHKEVFMPPRREHICTSNLEKIHVSSVTSSSNINDTFLVDVLLAAKEEADFIKRKYGDKIKANGFNDKETICRAIKYSFADIGDIIKGTDLWDANSEEIKTQGNLVTIFKEIKEKLKSTLGDKYANDNDGKHTQLRADWWEANRDQVWKAMKCPLPSADIIKCGPTPYDDYVPQRLRWMTEWAEWYCKEQSRAYTTLVNGCKQCREMGGKCMKDDGKCETCTKACNTYKAKIKKWEDQWEKISQKYKTLYQQANDSVNGATTSSSTDEKDKDVVDFLKKLYQQNKENNKWMWSKNSW
ncbi:hypothetical protein PFTANZ_06679 [Plasmodium falciparum Tanzania (2000708)]|uniref:Duffy-binding-like domain-containing protein n=1 Tax=Plasmodium falciparum Tanzania (2000708) TaxID=1036725 RepID=A0A024VV39_PLAFA|nr:hypothetical protein PFTANZ_06679 [Plasmodium falciparum Tanzania (2000708)]